MFAVIELTLWGNKVLREGHSSSSLFLKKKEKKVFLVTSYFVQTTVTIYKTTRV